MTQDMMILEKTMEYIYYIRYDDLGKPMNKLFHSKKLWERVGGGGWGIPRRTNPLSKRS